MRIDWARDEIILACALVMDNVWRGLNKTDPRVVELSALLRAAPLHPMEDRDETFRNGDGVGRKTWDIATSHPEYKGKRTRGNRLDREVLDEFLADPDQMTAIAAEIREALQRGDVPGLADEASEAADSEAREGRLLLARHLRRERSPRLRRAKIAKVKAQGHPVACEVCGFDFKATYGDRGADYIEVHHVLPLHVSGEVRTRLEDLAMLCANCHRMIHRGNPWLTPDDLRSLLSGPRRV